MVLSTYQLNTSESEQFYEYLGGEVERGLRGKLYLSSNHITVVHFCTEAAEASTGKWNLLHNWGERAALRELRLRAEDGAEYWHIMRLILRQLQVWVSNPRRPITWLDVHYATEEQGMTARGALADIYDGYLLYSLPGMYEMLAAEAALDDLDEDELDELREELGIAGGSIGTLFADDESPGLSDLFGAPKQGAPEWREGRLMVPYESLLEVIVAVGLNFSFSGHWCRLITRKKTTPS